MRTIELRRHSFTKKGEERGRGSHLSGEGVTAARRAGEALGPFDRVIVSTSPRTMETAMAMGFAVDELVEMPSPVETGEIEFHAWRAWDDPFTALQERAASSPSVDAYLEQQASRVAAILGSVADGGSVLVVGHGGWLESVVARLVAPDAATTLGGSFWHLDGIRLAVTPTSVDVEAVARHPR
jgi:broad specificity phosphatase PhoE